MCLNVELSRGNAHQLQEINDQLSALSSDTENPPSQSMLRAIQRHREVYLDYARELRRTKVCPCCAARTRTRGCDCSPQHNLRGGRAT